MRLSTKLFLPLLTSCLLITAVSNVAARLSFRKGFLGYLNEQTYGPLKLMSNRLEKAYAEHGSWDWIRGDMPTWIDMTRENLNPNFSLPPSEAWMLGVFHRMAVFDRNKKLVTGNPAARADMQNVPIVVDGVEVGLVSIVPLEKVTGEANIRFEQQQYFADQLIGIGSVITLALASVFLSRWLASPLHRIAAAMHTLTKGDYSPRLSETSNDEMGRLASDFNELAGALQRTEALRRTFVADISHELRTPLAVLRAELEAIEDGVRTPSTDTIQSLAAEVATMSKLVSDLYDISLSDVGALAVRKSRADAGEVLRLTLVAFRERLAERSLRVESQIPDQTPLIDGDEARLHQLFNNLLENSARYTNPGGRIRWRVSFDAHHLFIDCEDSAPGLTEHQLSKLFQRFYRADPSRNRATGGAGLGLAICSAIVQAHGGHIEARHSHLGGIWIHVRMPLASEVQEEPAYSH